MNPLMKLIILSVSEIHINIILFFKDIYPDTIFPKAKLKIRHLSLANNSMLFFHRFRWL